MSALIADSLPRGVVQAKAISLIGSGLIALAVFSGGFVISEPAPYELLLVALMVVWVLFGLRFSRHAAILLTLLVAFNIGGLISMSVMEDLYGTPMYLAVSLFLAFTSVFFVAILEEDHRRYKLIFAGWVAGALATGTLGILGYFGLIPGAAAFTLYDRAAGAFKDPNVFGPFLTLPGMWLLYRLLTGNPLVMPLYAAAFIVIVTAIFLSFSRGAWGLFAFSAIFVIMGLFLQSQSVRFRLRLVLMSTLALALLAFALLVAIQLPGVADLFSTRARLVQDYDTAQYGRFARFGIGFLMATENPFGIGPLNFGRIFGEDTHNIWLKALMDYGWLGFAAFVTLVIWTVAGGFRILFRDRPWQPYLLCAYAVFIGHLLLGTVIDMDHWRHFYLLIGLIWGAMALEVRHARAAKTLAAA